MADLDVAVRLKFLTAGEEKLKAAARDLQAFGKASGKLSTAATGRLGGDLSKAWTASVKLGGALDKSAGAASRTAASLNRIGAEARDIDRARVAVEKLSKANKTLGMSAAGARAREAGLGASGVVAAGAVGGAAAKRRREARTAFLSEAASRVTPEGYLIGAGGAVALGAAVGGTAAAGVAAAGLATKEAIDREKAFAEIRKKVNLDAGESWDTLDRKVRKVSTTLGMGYDKAAAIFAQGGQGNVAYRDLEGFAMLGAKVATAWDIGAKEAAQMLTEVKAQTNWTIPQLQTFGDKVNFLGDISAAAEKDIGAMWQRASAGAKAAGVSYDDSMVALTALRGVGMQDEVSARFFGAFSSKLRRATTLSGDAQAAFKALGLSAKDIEKGMDVDAMGTMIKFLDRLSKSKDAVRIATGVGGGEWFDEILRFKEALGEMLRLREALAKGGFSGSLDKALDIDLGTTQAKLNKLKESILDIAATAAKPIALPWLSEVADKWSAAAERFRNAQQRSEESRAQVKPKGLSIADYERVHGLNQPEPKAASVSRQLPMIAGVEGATPHVNVKQVNVEMAEATAKANDLYSALQQLNTGVTPSVNVGGAIQSLDALQAKAAATAQTLRSLSNFGPPALGGARVNPTISGAPAGRGGSTGSAPAAPAATTPGKQARLGRGGYQIANLHLHGVQSPEAFHRRMVAMSDRRVRSVRDGALHDLA